MLLASQMAFVSATSSRTTLIDECNVTDSQDSMLVGAGNCDVDVDECVSS